MNNAAAKTAASFNAATLAPIGSLIRAELATVWVYAAMHRCDDVAVAYAAASLRGWQTLGAGAPNASDALNELISECDAYLADASAAA